MINYTKKVGIFGNSQSLPIKNKISIHKTYPYLLQRYLKKFVVLNFSSSGDSIKNFVDKFVSSSVSNKLDVVIIQYGIVECSPRVFLSNELDYIKKTFPKYIQVLIRKFVHLFRRQLINIIGNRMEVSERTFFNLLDESCKQVKKTFPYSKLILLEIPKLPIEMERVSPGINKNILSYNKTIKKICIKHNVFFCGLNGAETNDFLPREVHFKDILAKKYAKKLQEFILS